MRGDRSERIAQVVGVLEDQLADLEEELQALGDEGERIVRFALYRIVQRRLVDGGYLADIRWTEPPFPEEGDRESRP